MADIFISYHRHDRKHAAALAARLKKRKYTVWWDSQILAGEPWAEMIEEQLNVAGTVLVLWSRKAVESSWVRDEAAYALELERTVISVKLERVSIPLPFRVTQEVDLTNWRGESHHSGLRRLEAILRRAESDRPRRRQVGAAGVKGAPLEQRLRRLRANLDFTQEQLAELIGVSISTIGRWERGDSRPRPLAERAIRRLEIGEALESEAKGETRRKRL